MTARKARTDSVAGAKQAFENASADLLQPPKHVVLRAKDIPFWGDIVRAREQSSWNESDLVAAAQLARCRADIEDIQVIIDRGPLIVVNARGTEVPNPHFMIMENLVRRQQSLMRMLYVHAQATVGSTGTAANKAKAQRDASEKLGKKTDGDDEGGRPLLAGTGIRRVA